MEPNCNSSFSACIRHHIKQYLSKIADQNNDSNSVYSDALSVFDAEIVQISMQYCDGNKTKAAKLLGLSRHTLSAKLKSIK